ncbi:MAG: prolyl oligopeptidase family serine peptidase [Proteobacteria bacterium]|nr:prolyl oligopeptidase family serine peptidase [Pseudomonadota bacterium]
MNGRRRLRALVGTCALALAVIAPAAAPGAGTRTFEQRLAALREAVRSGRETRLTYGSLTTIDAYITDLRRNGTKYDGYEGRMTRLVEETLSAAEAGQDAIAGKRGMFWRGYASRYSYFPQMYSIYVPKKYDGAERLPLIVSLHGGSSNHNVWLALNLGNTVAVADYWDNFRTEYRAGRHPNAIVVAPDGLGQIRWRWSGEQDVLDVIDDVLANYNVDRDRIVISGLSNGGIGSYTIGLKHASRFSAVLPLSGVVDWLNHYEAAGRHRRCEKTVLANESAITYAENAQGTYLRFFHGVKDSGFSVEQTRSLQALLERLGIPFTYNEFSALGHDLSHVLWRSLLVADIAKKRARQIAPTEVRLVTASPRAVRQHWMSLDERIDHTRPARLVAQVVDGSRIDIETENAERVTIHFAENPVEPPFSVRIDGHVAYEGMPPPRGALTFVLALAPGLGKGAAAGAPAPVTPWWREWDGATPLPGTRKAGQVVGPIGDANYDPQVHVYGTQVAEDVPLLKRAAQLGARGWMAAWDYTEVRHPVVADVDLTWEMLRDRAVVLYGNARNNSVLAAMGARLPIVVGEDYLELRGERLEGRGVGARFVCPNPLAPDRYLVVCAGTTAEAVERGGRLPIYLADYIVYDDQTTRKRAFMILGGRPEIETGFFTEDWKLPPKAE